MREQLVCLLRGDREPLSVPYMTQFLEVYRRNFAPDWPTVTEEGVEATLKSFECAGSAKRVDGGWIWQYPTATAVQTQRSLF